MVDGYPNLLVTEAGTEVTGTSRNPTISKTSFRRRRGEDDPLLKYVAAQIVSARQKRGLTQDQLAERAGCAPLTVTNVESGRHNVMLMSLASLAAALEVDLPDLFPPAQPIQQCSISEDLAKKVVESLGRITSAAAEIEALLAREKGQSET